MEEYAVNEEQFELFVKFAERMKASGGPDPYMQVIGEAAKALEPQLARLLVDCFASVYTISGAAVMTALIFGSGENWPDIVCTHRKQKGIPVRRERRRPAGSPTKLVTSTKGLMAAPVENAKSYDELYSIGSRARHVGRYATMKWCVALYESGLTPYQQPDIRAYRGKPTRNGLALIVPDTPIESDTEETIDEVEYIAAMIKSRVTERGLELKWWEYETLLCNFRQWMNGRIFIGRDFDKDFILWQRMRDYWQKEAPEVLVAVERIVPLLPLRERLFSEHVLYERQGWDIEQRAITLPDLPYMWSDIDYDYNATVDLMQPVLRAPVEEES